jgi:hypothetical protein
MAVPTLPQAMESVIKVTLASYSSLSRSRISLPEAWGEGSVCCTPRSTMRLLPSMPRTRMRSVPMRISWSALKRRGLLTWMRVVEALALAVRVAFEFRKPCRSVRLRAGAAARRAPCRPPWPTSPWQSRQLRAKRIEPRSAVSSSKCCSAFIARLGYQSA